MLFQGGFDYKKAIVDTIITIIEENTEAKEAGTFTIIFPSLSLFSLRGAIFVLTTKFRGTETIFLTSLMLFFIIQDWAICVSSLKTVNIQFLPLKSCIY